MWDELIGLIKFYCLIKMLLSICFFKWGVVLRYYVNMDMKIVIYIDFVLCVGISVNIIF